jgi:succinate dehydrogenase / fumarate reductase flavoprotein subunit
MVWPPSVRGILVTESVRGDGGTLKNKSGEQFMFNYITEYFKGETADNIEEAERWYADKKNNRRTPNLLPRDEVARAINAEVKAGRGSPHGGVFLDIAWITRRLPNAPEHIRKKLPSMYHQFKELAGIDITSAPMEVGPTTHYIMGGIRVDSDTQMSTVPGLFAAGECAAGINGANRLGGNSLSDLLVFGKLAGEHAAVFARANAAPSLDERQIDAASKRALAPFDRGAAAENPFKIQQDLQGMMQDLVGIVRAEDEMQQAIGHLEALNRRAANAGITGHREYHSGWHTAQDLGNLLIVSEAITRSAMERKESRGGHFRQDYPDKDPAYATFNVSVRRGADGRMQVSRVPIPPMPAELKKVIEDNK